MTDQTEALREAFRDLRSLDNHLSTDYAAKAIEADAHLSARDPHHRQPAR